MTVAMQKAALEAMQLLLDMSCAPAADIMHQIISCTRLQLAGQVTVNSAAPPHLTAVCLWSRPAIPVAMAGRLSFSEMIYVKTAIRPRSAVRQHVGGNE